MKQNKGAVLTGIILMVLVMTLIGVPLISMVVYNYRLRELDNGLRRSEYENEMAMDKVAVIVRNTVIDAIEYAKSNATEAVNKSAELQKSGYSDLYSLYSTKWVNANALYKSGNTSQEVTDIVGVDGEVDKDTYVQARISDDLDKIQSEQASDNGLNDTVGCVVNNASGNVDAELLNTAYNNAFAKLYQEEIVKNISGNILNKTEYSDVFTFNEEDISKPLTLLKNDSGETFSYLKISAPEKNVLQNTEWINKKLSVDVSTTFKKNKTVPPTTLSATFVISTPSFDDVASVTQQTVPLSNALLSQGGLIAGGKLTIKEDSTLNTFCNIIVQGKNLDTSIELENGAKLLAGDDSASRIATNKDILLNGGSELVTGVNPIYYKNLYVGKALDTAPINVEFNGDVVAEDDLEIISEGKVTINQTEGKNYYGFNDTNNKGPDSSSSIVVNSAKINDEGSKKTLSLGNLYLAGRAFVNEIRMPDEVIAEEGQTLSETEKEKGRYYKSGESIAVKGNYIAYQTPLFNEDTTKWYLPYKMIFSVYFLDRGENAERKYSEVRLVDNFSVAPAGMTPSKAGFDSQYKWQYFCEYAKNNSLKILDIISNIIYIQGAGFNNNAVVGSSNVGDNIKDTSFKDNLALEYEKYTQYFGYRPVKEEDGKVVVDNDKAKSEIFGNSGWIKDAFTSKEIPLISPFYYQIYNKDISYDITLSGDNNYGIIVCENNLNIEIGDNDLSTTDDNEAIFSGLIVAGGNINISGGTLMLADAKDDTINIVIGNYLGTNTSDEGGSGGGSEEGSNSGGTNTGTVGNLYNSFAYDDSGTTYVITNMGDNLININDLIGITNWRKSRYGRL